MFAVKRLSCCCRNLDSIEDSKCPFLGFAEFSMQDSDSLLLISLLPRASEKKKEILVFLWEYAAGLFKYWNCCCFGYSYQCYCMAYEFPAISISICDQLYVRITFAVDVLVLTEMKKTRQRIQKDYDAMNASSAQGRHYSSLLLQLL